MAYFTFSTFSGGGHIFFRAIMISVSGVPVVSSSFAAISLPGYVCVAMGCHPLLWVFYLLLGFWRFNRRDEWWEATCLLCNLGYGFNIWRPVRSLRHRTGSPTVRQRFSWLLRLPGTLLPVRRYTFSLTDHVFKRGPHWFWGRCHRNRSLLPLPLCACLPSNYFLGPLWDRH